MNFSAEKFGGIEKLRIFAVLKFLKSKGERVRLMHRIRAFFMPLAVRLYRRCAHPVMQL